MVSLRYCGVLLIEYTAVHQSVPQEYVRIPWDTIVCYILIEYKVWVETAAEGGRRFMAAWRKEEVDAARHRQEKREATRL